MLTKRNARLLGSAIENVNDSILCWRGVTLFGRQGPFHHHQETSIAAAATYKTRGAWHAECVGRQGAQRRRLQPAPTEAQTGTPRVTHLVCE